MNQRYRSNSVNEFLVKNLLPWFTLAVNILLVTFILILIVRDFMQGMAYGVRGLAATAIPLVVVALLKRYGQAIKIDEDVRRNWLVNLASSPLTGIFIAAIWGFILFVIIEYFNGREGSRLPFAELVLSSTFVSLINYAGTVETKAESWYSGVVLGFLFYIFLNGLPF